MLYAILAYHVETEVMSWTAQEDAAVMAGLKTAQDRLMQDTRGPGAGAVIDGPFAETKEQLLGFYVMEFDSEDGAIAAARDLRRANPSAVYEIRPVLVYRPGTSFPLTET